MARLALFTLVSLTMLAAACGPDSHTLPVSSGNASITAPPTHTADATPSIHYTNIVDIAFSPDGHVLATTGECRGHGCKAHHGEVRLWDVTTRRLLGKPLPYFSAGDVAFSPDGRILASVDYDREEVWLWNVATHQALGEPLRPRPYRQHENGILAIAFSPDGRTLATSIGYADYGNSLPHKREVWLWDVATHRVVGEPLCRGDDPINYVAFSPDGRILATAVGPSPGVRLWDITAHPVREMQPLAQPPKESGQGDRIAFSPDGRTLALVGIVGTGKVANLTFWDMATRRVSTVRLSRTRNFIILGPLAFSPDRASVVAGYLETTTFKGVIFWDLFTGNIVGKPLSLSGYDSGSVFKLAFSPNGRMLAVASEGGDQDAVRLWDVATHHLVGEPLRHFAD